MCKEKSVIAFGVGTNFYALVERLDSICKITAFCDNDERKWGQHLMGDERVCVKPNSLCDLEDPFVLIMSERESSIQAIEHQCDSYGILHQRVHEFLKGKQLKTKDGHWLQSIQKKEFTNL